MKKYTLTKEKKVQFGITLFRIKANVAFGIIAKGELGGWIEKEDNLDQSGNAWVYGDARVYGNAWVYGDARVYGNAWVYGDAWVYGKIKCEVGFYFGYIQKGENVIEIKEEEGV